METLRSPAEAYVFMVQRPCDKEPWACVYTNRELAEGAYCRITRVRRVSLRYLSRAINRRKL